MRTVMTFQYLLGLLSFVQVTALSLQSGNHVARAFDGDDWRAQLTARNQSEAHSDRLTCECCWRECDLSQEETKDFIQQEELTDGSLQHPSFDEESEMWKAGDRMDNIDAWLIVNGGGRADKVWGIYMPIIETIKEAIRGHGGVTAQIGGDLHLQQMMVKSVRMGLSKGRRPLVFTIGHETWGAEIHQTLDLIKQASDAGAYVVSYQGEPGFGHHGAGAGKVQKTTQDLAKIMGAHEIWEYCKANINHYVDRPDRTHIVRFVPPGYVRKLDAGVDVNSKLTQPTSIGYIGNTNADGSYAKPMQEKYLNMFGDRLNASNNIWTPQDLRTFLETYPIQLNQHRWQTCCPREPWEAEYQHFEPFRMASLLANKACVISGPSSDEDMKIWQGMVTFAEVENTMSTFARLGKSLKECRLRSYETFKREFAPNVVLTKSGFFEAWRPPHGK